MCEFVSRARSVARSLSLIALTAGLLGLAAEARADSSDIVLYASEAPVVKGNWKAASSSGAAGAQSMASSDLGWSMTEAPLASPQNYFEMSFDAPAGTTYRVWLRLRGANDSKWNESVWVQFSDAVLSNGSSAYRIGSTSGLLVNLERCSGCGISSWGWQNRAWWLSQANTVKFAATGKHTVRVQIREDGVELDQIVLSPETYMSEAPGEPVDDTVIVPKATSPPPPSSELSPYGGTAVTVPGTIDATRFDEGGKNVAYYDTSAGNAGGSFRSTDVDIQPAAGGGYNVGWTMPGEWLKYTVDVQSAGNYTAQLGVASMGGGAMEVTLGVPAQP